MVVHVFPLKAAPMLGHWLGRILRLYRKGYRTAKRNIARADLNVSLDLVYDNIGTCMIEVLMIPRLITRREVHKACRIEGLEIVDGLLAEGKGVIFVAGHLGNYEIGGILYSMLGYPVNSLARTIRNPWIDRMLTRYRTQTGQRIISTDNPIGQMIRVLRRNEILTIEIDQDAKGDGILIDFLGSPTSVYRSAGLFSIKYGAPIVVLEFHREGGMNVSTISQPIRPDVYKDDPDGIEKITRLVTAEFERKVRAHPEEWFWVYDRWRGADKILRKKRETQ